MTLKIEAGKFYRTLGGWKVGPMEVRDDETYPWGGWLSDQKFFEKWTASGKFYGYIADGHPRDLVAEWTDEPEKTIAEIIDSAKQQAPDTNPKTRVGLTKPSLRAIPSSALLHLGAAMEDGRKKYGLFDWREHAVSASVYEDAIWRHMLAWRDGEDLAADSTHHHLAHVMACCAILLDAIEVGNLNDDRGLPGTAPAMLKAWTKQALDV